MLFIFCILFQSFSAVKTSKKLKVRMFKCIKIYYIYVVMTKNIKL